MKKVIWTVGYNPWVMGGDVHAPSGFETEVDKPVDIGKGFKAYVVKSPNKKVTLIAEATTGAIVGNSLRTVRKDVGEGDVEMMKAQVKGAAEMVKKVVLHDAAYFWNHYKGGKGE